MTVKHAPFTLIESPICILANIKENDEVNLERAMSGSGRFGGHFVLGHVDAKGTIINIRETPNSRIVSIPPKCPLPDIARSRLTSSFSLILAKYVLFCVFNSH
jgi:hypothetical protein